MGQALQGNWSAEAEEELRQLRYFQKKRSRALTVGRALISTLSFENSKLLNNNEDLTMVMKGHGISVDTGFGFGAGGGGGPGLGPGTLGIAGWGPGLGSGPGYGPGDGKLGPGWGPGLGSGSGSASGGPGGSAPGGVGGAPGAPGMAPPNFPPIPGGPKPPGSSLPPPIAGKGKNFNYFKKFLFFRNTNSSSDTKAPLIKLPPGGPPPPGPGGRGGPPPPPGGPGGPLGLPYVFFFLGSFLTTFRVLPNAAPNVKMKLLNWTKIPNIKIRTYSSSLSPFPSPFLTPPPFTLPHI